MSHRYMCCGEDDMEDANDFTFMRDMLCSSQQHTDDSNQWGPAPATEVSQCMLHMFDEIGHQDPSNLEPFPDHFAVDMNQDINGIDNVDGGEGMNVDMDGNDMGNDNDGRYVEMDDESTDSPDFSSTSEMASDPHTTHMSELPRYSQIERDISEMIDSQTDPVGKFLRDRVLTAQAIIQLDLHEIVLNAPKTPRRKYGPRTELTEQQRNDMNKKRNRDHAWATRQRKKIFEMIDERLEASSASGTM
ncbi:hypothetical protein B484DRAFT_477529 [Ochromonadaceae sp. CCMP2298]|nr:hypothetical protein B484DRAFT_477529 [Ochromonadaceae sp. CCMP2298]